MEDDQAFQLHSFEDSLTNEPPLNFNLDEFLNQAHERVENNSKWYEKMHNISREDMFSVLNQRTIPLERRIGQWGVYFSGKIPASWNATKHDGQQQIFTDLKKADELNYDLSVNLIDAAVSHPLARLAEYAGLHQRLDSIQLGVLASRDEIQKHVLAEIVRKQKKLGLSTDELSEAKQFEQRFRNSQNKINS